MSAESELIRGFIRQWGARASGIGDDAAILDVPPGEKLVISTDAAVENIHFRRTNVSPTEIGYRAAAAALSDLAAMAARPLGLLFALVLPVSWRDDATSIADGVGSAADASKCPIIGGNVSSGEELSITTTVLGSSPAPLTRSGARSGDSLYVTGSLGGAASAVLAWERGGEPAPDVRKKFVQPSPRIGEGLWLASHGASSGVDISDGLTTDASHLAEASGVTLTIDVELVPLFAGVPAELALAGGEDYELLVTATNLDTEEFRRTFNLPLTRIGSITQGEARVTLRKHGSAFGAPSGYDHLNVK